MKTTLILTAAALATTTFVMPASSAATAAGARGAEVTGAVAKVRPKFSKPDWLPLRQETSVHCVRTNCGPGQHGFWAIDFMAVRHPKLRRTNRWPVRNPIYAAGYGVAHVGSRGNRCLGLRRPSRPVKKRGNWVWIDHGRGQKTLYFHLAKIMVRDRQRVTPNTLLGPMGKSGKCGPDPYLHYERRWGRVDGDPQKSLAPLMRKACHGAKLVYYPRAFGVRSWDDVAWNSRVWSDGARCAVA